MDGQAVINEEIRRQIMDHMGKMEVAFRELDPEGKGETPLRRTDAVLRCTLTVSPLSQGTFRTSTSGRRSTSIVDSPTPPSVSSWVPPLPSQSPNAAREQSQQPRETVPRLSVLAGCQVMFLRLEAWLTTPSGSPSLCPSESRLAHR